METVIDSNSPLAIVENVVGTVLEESDEGAQPKPVAEEAVAEDIKAMEELDIDTSTWAQGEVSDWKHTWGFLVAADRSENSRGERIFVHASKINFADPKKPFLRKGMQVRYHAGVRREDNSKKVAVDVSAVDGSPINWFQKHGESDPYSRKTLGDTVYKGKVKKFFYRKSYGWIEPEENIDIVGFDNSRHIFVTREDIVCKDFPPGLKPQQEVEFKIYKDDRGFGASEVTGKDGVPLESPYGNEKDFEGKVFTGTVVKFRVNRFIFIRPHESLVEYGFFGKEDLHANCEDINTEQRPARVSENTKITFRLYKNQNGFHAVDINDENGDPIFVKDFEEERSKVREEHEGEYEGTVKFFRWDNGSGWIRPSETSKIPEVMRGEAGHVVEKPLSSMSPIATGPRMSGVVKWFNPTKGFGFITPDNGGLDVFVHQSEIQLPGFRSLAQGEPVEYQLYDGQKGPKALKVTGPQGKLVKGAPRQSKTGKTEKTTTLLERSPLQKSLLKLATTSNFVPNPVPVSTPVLAPTQALHALPSMISTQTPAASPQISYIVAQPGLQNYYATASDLGSFDMSNTMPMSPTPMMIESMPMSPTPYIPFTPVGQYTTATAGNPFSFANQNKQTVTVNVMNSPPQVPQMPAFDYSNCYQMQMVQQQQDNSVLPVQYEQMQTSFVEETPQMAMQISSPLSPMHV